MRHIFPSFFLLLTLSQHVVMASREEAETLPQGALLFSTENEALLSDEQKKFYESAGGKDIRLHKKLVRVQRAALDGEAVSLVLFDKKSARLELQKQPGEPVWKGRTGGLIRFSLRETAPGCFVGYLVQGNNRYVIRPVGTEGLAAFYEEQEEKGLNGCFLSAGRQSETQIVLGGGE